MQQPMRGSTSDAASSSGRPALPPCRQHSKGCPVRPPAQLQVRQMQPPRALAQPLAELAQGLDPALSQDILIGGAIFAAIGFSLYNGLKGEPEICPSCQGSGGVRCFACEGTGKMMGVPLQMSPQKRAVIGKNKDPRTCSACLGSGLLRCKKCTGTGYVNRM